MFKSKMFWILFTILTIASGFFVKKTFPEVMSIVNVSIDIDRDQAIEKANILAEAFHFDTKTFQKTALFQFERNVANYIELKAGGKEKFNEIVKGNEYHPFYWSVRFFKNKTIDELYIYFTPAGEKIGFYQKIPEHYQGKNIAESSAEKLVQNAFPRWNIDAEKYHVIERKNETTINNRIDYSFTFEHKEFQLKEARLRIETIVSGDKVTSIRPYLFVPESFFNQYENMRALNHSIASFASTAMSIIYGLGVLFALYFLLHKRKLIWKAPLYWALFIAFLEFLVSLNNLPLYMFYMDTSTTISMFLLERIIQAFSGFVTDFVLLWVSFMAGESLTRIAFPNKVQFWKSWSTGSGNTLQLFGTTVGSYFVAIFEIVFVMGFYLITTRYFGWWNPSSSLVNPNAIATPFPWLPAIASALHAGFWEETLFRAVPIAGGILIGRKLGKEKLFFVLALVLQALIFSAGHANYPTQPGYARFIELLIPSFIFAFLYLRFGLLSAILMHFVFDAILMSVPIWVTSSSSMHLNRGIFLVLLFVPWFILFYRTLRHGFAKSTNPFQNKTWKSKNNKVKEFLEIDSDISYNFASGKWAILLGIISLISISILFFHLEKDVQPLQISKQKAIKIAIDFVEKQQVSLPQNYTIKAIPQNKKSKQDKFLWQSVNPRVFRSYLDDIVPSPVWNIRFITFKGELEERQKQFRVTVNGSGDILGFKGKCAEVDPLPSLAEEDALKLVQLQLEKQFNEDVKELILVSVKPKKRPNRTDWEIIYKRNEFEVIHSEFRYKVNITGNFVSAIKKYAHIPEEWDRKNNEKRAQLSFIRGIIRNILMFVSFVVLATCIVIWSRKHFSPSVFKTMSGLFFIISLLNNLNRFAFYQYWFSVNQSFLSQLIRIFFQTLIQTLFFSFAVGLLLGIVNYWRSREKFSLGIGIGIGIGSVFSFILYGFQALLPKVAPLRSSVQIFGTYIPGVAVLLQSISNFILLVTLVSILVLFLDQMTKKCQRRKGISFAGIFLVITALLMNFYLEEVQFATISIISIAAFIMTFLFILFYRLYFRFSFIPIAYSVGCFLILSRIYHIFTRNYTGFFYFDLLAIFTTVYLVYLTAHFLEHKQ